MHLHRMRLSALGPFPGEHEIDFGELGAGGLFLLEGPTGSGKSTLIDAVVFALYGKVASAGATEERLRSTHVGPGIQSFVDLVFETGSGIFRVRRSPAYDRPKQRGTGTVRQNTAVQLWRLSAPDAEDGESLSTRADEVGPEIVRAIGLTREQFVQTVVLPQGEFATFLKARPEDRGGLLQQVFGTEVYQRIQTELVEARKAADRRLRAARETISTAAASFGGAADLTEDEHAQLQRHVQGADPDALLEVVEAHRERLGTLRCKQDAAATRRAEERTSAAEAERGAAERRAAAHRREELLRRREALESDAAAQGEREATIAAAERASAVLAYVEAADRAQADLGTADAALHDAMAAAPVDGALAGSDTIDLGAELVRRREARDALTAAAELERGVPGRERELARERDRLGQDDAACRELDELIAARPAQRTALAAERDGAREAAARLEDATRRLADAHRAHEHAVAAGALAVRAQEARERLEAATAGAREAVTEETRLRRARIAGIAGELAEELRGGEPCPVCGAADHPRPAAKGADHVDAAQVEAAEHRRALAERTLEGARQALAGLEQEHAERHALAGGFDAPRAQAAVEAEQAAVSGAQQAVRTVADLDARLGDFDAETARLEERRQEAGVVRDRRTGQIDRAQQLLDADCATLAGTVAAHGGGAEGRAETLLAAVTGDVAALEELEQRRAARERAQTRVDQCAADLRAALAEHGFAGAETVREAAVPSAQRRELAARVRAYATEAAQVAGGLAEPALAQLPADLSAERAEQDHAAASAELARAVTAADQAAGALARVDAVCRRAESAATALGDAVRGAATLMTELAPVLRMASLADATSSDNAHAVTLATYVLARRFEEVLAAANQRLSQMSSGRYELRRSDQKEAKGGRRLGLALRVVDHVGDRSRDPASLSGGETF
ncbi:MAG: AAA family ATPase, partial [Cellulomonadaceae bacterium]